MTDELQQARDDAMYACEMAAAAWVRASLLADREDATTLQMAFNRAVKDYAEVATREYREALRRYMTYEETFGYERLVAEFGAPEFPESSWSMEEGLDRVLRGPARALLPQPVPTAPGEEK